MRTGVMMDTPVTQWIGHSLSLGVIVATLAQFLPAFAAAAAAIWYAVQIYESDTCQHWLEKRRMKHKARKIASLRAQQKVLLAELEALEIVREARVVAADKVASAAHEAATTLTQANTHEKIHDGGAVIKSSPPEAPADPKASGAA